MGLAHAARGCSLVEVLVAMTLFAVAAAAVAQMTTFAARTNLQAGRSSLATIIAQQKLEELLGDAGSVLQPSPAGALTASLDGWFDFVDPRGRSIAAGVSPPSGSDYLRRWSVAPLSGTDALIVQVVVTDVRNAGVAAPASPGQDQVRIVAVKGRQGF